MSLVTLMNRLISSLENDEHVLAIFLDFSKAFDTVVHVDITEKSWLTVVLDYCSEIVWELPQQYGTICDVQWHISSSK